MPLGIVRLRSCRRKINFSFYLARFNGLDSQGWRRAIEKPVKTGYQKEEQKTDAPNQLA